MREAYTLLRQSIIHVEQDDIDFDEDELEDKRDETRPTAAATADEDDDDDVHMTVEEMEAMDQMEESSIPQNVRVVGRQQAPPSSSSRADSVAVADAAPPPPAPKRRMVITYDKYTSLRDLIVLHVGAAERETARGIDRDELVDWYLEFREDDIQDVDELEYEKELIIKMLRKLVKVCGGSVQCLLQL